MTPSHNLKNRNIEQGSMAQIIVTNYFCNIWYLMDVKVQSIKLHMYDVFFMSAVEIFVSGIDN